MKNKAFAKTAANSECLFSNSGNGGWWWQRRKRRWRGDDKERLLSACIELSTITLSPGRRHTMTADEPRADSPRSEQTM